MKRKIVRIDEELCDGCGDCVPSCHEGAIEIVDGKARLISDKLCDGIGDCLGECPQGAISIIEREAEGYDEVLVQARQAAAQLGVRLRQRGRTPAQADDGERESFIRCAVDRETDPAVLGELENEIRQVLADIKLAVRDWKKMRAKMIETKQALEQGRFVLNRETVLFIVVGAVQRVPGREIAITAHRCVP